MDARPVHEDATKSGVPVDTLGDGKASLASLVQEVKWWQCLFEGPDSGGNPPASDKASHERGMATGEALHEGEAGPRIVLFDEVQGHPPSPAGCFTGRLRSYQANVFGLSAWILGSRRAWYRSRGSPEHRR